MDAHYYNGSDDRDDRWNDDSGLRGHRLWWHYFLNAHAKGQATDFLAQYDNSRIYAEWVFKARQFLEENGAEGR